MMLRIKYMMVLLVACGINQSIAQVSKSVDKALPGAISGAYEVHVDVSSFKGTTGKLYLRFFSTDRMDSVSVDGQQNVVKFNAGSVLEPIVVGLFWNDDKYRDSTSLSRQKHQTVSKFTFYLTGGKHVIKAKEPLNQSVLLTENGLQSDYFKLTRAQQAFVEKNLSPLYSLYFKAHAAKDSLGMGRLKFRFDSLKNVLYQTIQLPFVKTRGGDSPVALWLIQDLAGADPEPAQIMPLLNFLSPKLKALPTAKRMIAIMEAKKTIKVGMQAPDFTQTDTLGKMVSLSDYKGKYVLIDFWASWCGPCRAENPNVVSAFQRFSENGFTVLGVSLDTSREKWLQGIVEDHLTWAQLSDLKGGDNAVSKLYGISFIPQNVLVDPNGKILAKNLRGEELIDFLAKTLLKK